MSFEVRYRSSWLLITLVSFGGCASRGPEAAPVAALQAELRDALDAEGSADVIINLREPAGPFERSDGRQLAIEQMQREVMTSLGSGFTLVRRYKHVPALAGRITKQALEQITLDPNVVYVQLDSQGGGQLKEAVPAIGGDKARAMFNVSGKGVRVAVLDTGADLSHPDLKDAIVAQHCYTRGGCPPGRTNEGTSAQDDHGHGSNVTGIIASKGMVSSVGFAPDVELVVVKINDRNDSGRESDWVAGLDWIYDNLTTTKVDVVNLSIGTNAMYSSMAECNAGSPALGAAIKNLIDKGIVVFAASGNRGSATQMAAPACLSGVIAVGATYDSAVGHQPPSSQSYAARWGQAFGNCADDPTAFDQITCFTNSNARLDLVAPGAPVISDTLNGRTESYWGTSQASPVAAGVAALMVQCKPGIKPDEIKLAMTSTGVPQMDKKNGMTFPSLRALEAVQAACKGSAGAPPAAGSGGMLPQAGAVAVAGSGAGTGAAGGGVDASVPLPAAGTGVLIPTPEVAGRPAVAGTIGAPVALAGTSASAGTSAGQGSTSFPVAAAGTTASPSSDEEDGCSCQTVGSRKATSLPLGGITGLLIALYTASRIQRRARAPLHGELQTQRGSSLRG